MANYILGNVNYINYTAVSGDAEISINPIIGASYRVCNIGNTNENLVVKDLNTTTTIVEIEDGQVTDLVYDGAWRTLGSGSASSIAGDLTVSGTINTATITGGTWSAEKSGWINQDVSTAGTPDFQEMYIDTNFVMYYETASNAVVFAATDGVSKKRLMMFNAAMNIYNGDDIYGILNYLDRTIDGGDLAGIASPTNTYDGGSLSDIENEWTYKLF